MPSEPTAPLSCWRCGASVAELSLPLRRADECPQCRAELHVCKMCAQYAPRLRHGCQQDDAPDVRNREAANFCDYFKPSAMAFAGGRDSADAAARTELARLFGESRTDAATPGEPTAEPSASDPFADAEALFKR